MPLHALGTMKPNIDFIAHAHHILWLFQRSDLNNPETKRYLRKFGKTDIPHRMFFHIKPPLRNNLFLQLAIHGTDHTLNART